MYRIIAGLLIAVFIFGMTAEARDLNKLPIPPFSIQSLVPVIENASLSTSVFADSAYTILEGLATKRRNERVFGGLMTAAGGVVTGFILGAALESVSEEAAFYGFWVPTGIGVTLGGLSLLVPTEPEREFNEVQNFAPGTREAASADALQRLAEKAFVGRMVDGAIKVASAVASLILIPESDVLPYTRIISFASGIGSAVITFLVPTEEERAYQRYLRLSGA